MSAIPAFSTPDEAWNLAHIARKNGDVAGAVDIYRSALKVFTGKEHVAAAARGLRACGRWTEAVTLLEDGLKRQPNSTGLVLGLADAYAEMKHFSRAVACVQQYLDRNPDDPRVWRSLGVLSSLAGDWSGAEQAFAQSLKRQPLDIDAVLGHGEALYRVGRTEDAIAAYRRATVLKPEDPRGHLNLGSLLAVSADAGEAKTALFRAIELEPSSPAAHTNLARLYHRLNRHQRAIQSARQAINVDPEFVAAYQVMGEVLLDAAEVKGAVQILRVAAELAPGDATVITALAAAENAAGDPRTAERLLQRVLTIEPDNLEARHMLSAINGEPVRTVPAGYARQIFNWYAGRYDGLLAGPWKYRAPEELAMLLAEQTPDPKILGRFLDLGCGTGVVAEALAKRHAFDHETGIDIAENMIEVCRRKVLYDELIHGNAAEFLATKPGAFDLISAIDFFTYVGDLGALMPLIAGALAPGGMLAYSIEPLSEGRYRLQPNARFAHAPKYVEDLARNHGLVAVESREVTLRQENGADVPGVVALLRRQ